MKFREKAGSQLSTSTARRKMNNGLTTGGFEIDQLSEEVEVYATEFKPIYESRDPELIEADS